MSVFKAKWSQRVVYASFHYCHTSHFLFPLSFNNFKTKLYYKHISNIHKSRQNSIQYNKLSIYLQPNLNNHQSKPNPGLFCIILSKQNIQSKHYLSKSQILYHFFVLISEFTSEFLKNIIIIPLSRHKKWAIILNIKNHFQLSPT